MSEHSPAPWAYDGPPDNIHVFQANAPHMRICFLTSTGPTEANARLIAAAPELLEALKDVVSVAENRFMGMAHMAIDRARAAIAKAEGRS